MCWIDSTELCESDKLIVKRPRFWCKVLQLIANDQYQMGEYADKKMDPNVAIFTELIKQGIFPWHVAHPMYAEKFDSVHARAVLETLLTSSVSNSTDEAAVETTVEAVKQSLLGVPSIRKGEVMVHHDLIYGVPLGYFAALSDTTDEL